MSTIIPLNEKRLMLTTLRSDELKQNVRLDFGVYEETGREHPIEKWTGESLSGVIPLDALIAWALEQGYLHFETDEWLRRGDQP